MPFFSLSALRVRLLFCLFISLLTLSACESLTQDITTNWTVDKIHNEAKDELKNGGYDKAAGLLEKLEIRAAGTPLAQQAQVERAYALYKSNEQAQALAVIDRFTRLHPASPLIDYALYLRGLVNFNDNLGILGKLVGEDVSERDQKAAKESYESFRELSTRFPQSIYTADAQLRMNYILNSLAAYEVNVATYYKSRKAYLAAVNRAQAAITNYPQAPAIEQALEVMISSYDALGLTQLRDDAKRVMLKNFPKNILATK